MRADKRFLSELRDSSEEYNGHAIATQPRAFMIRRKASGDVRHLHPILYLQWVFHTNGSFYSDISLCTSNRTNIIVCLMALVVTQFLQRIYAQVTMSYSERTGNETIKPTFKVVGELSENLASTGKQVIDLAAGYIQYKTANVRSFDWAAFKDFIDNYKGDDLTIDRFNTAHINQGDMKVSRIVKAISDFYSSSVSLDKAELATIVTRVFTEPEKAKEGGWADFHRSTEDPKKSGWQYRIAFMLPYGPITGFFRSFLTTIKFEAEVEDEAGWHNLTTDSDLKGFTSLVELMGLIVMKGFENPLFDEAYLGLSSDLMGTTQQVTRLLNRYVKNDHGTRFFDWAGFKKAMEEYHGDDLVLDKFNQGDSSSSKRTVKALVDLIAVYLQDSFGGLVDISKVKEIVMSTFTSLQQRAGHGYLDFNKIEDKKSSWEYRVVFFTPMPNRQIYFYGTIVTIKVVADVSEESSWWGLQESSSQVFSASVRALRLVVGKGYRDTTQN